ncbi:hypothetical protein PanWU01x14_172780 [Parasponia andersonii]|uniref:Uncharacterized protein n=1 Tax=Parasponia andersonii TaxID=3476 RepID=A0A2P5C931_PARAD|nr:hypothetical protein PanWU01x14_172780 [Parasponia andersonii]
MLGSAREGMTMAFLGVKASTLDETMVEQSWNIFSTVMASQATTMAMAGPVSTTGLASSMAVSGQLDGSRKSKG